MNDYPRLVIDKTKFSHNINRTVELCREKGFAVSGVVKGFNGILEAVRLYDESDCAHIADSRLDRLKFFKQSGIKKPLMLLRLPMKCELFDVVRYCDISLNSDFNTIKEINDIAATVDVKHRVILMLDLGDLREGIFDMSVAFDVAMTIEKTLKNIVLEGVGTNLGCYGAITPTDENISKLVAFAKKIEAEIGRKLEIVSAGATSSLPLTLNGKMPKGANNLRVGEGLLLAQDLDKLWNYKIEGLHQDVFTLEAQVIEVSHKPSMPVGEMFVDAFGQKPTFLDEGVRKKALLALGKQDVGSISDLVPYLPGIRVLGGSSDHTILDITDCKEDIRVGSIITFEVMYGVLIFTTSSDTVKKFFI